VIRVRPRTWIAKLPQGAVVVDDAAAGLDVEAGCVDDTLVLRLVLVLVVVLEAGLDVVLDVLVLVLVLVLECAGLVVLDVLDELLLGLWLDDVLVLVLDDAVRGDCAPLDVWSLFVLDELARATAIPAASATSAAVATSHARRDDRLPGAGIAAVSAGVGSGGGDVGGGGGDGGGADGTGAIRVGATSVGAVVGASSRSASRNAATSSAGR
jgi:hypothetical protein